MSFEDVLGKLAEGTQKTAGQVMAQYVARQLDRATAAELLGTIIATGTAQGQAMGELSAAAWLDSVTGGAAVLPSGLYELPELDRLTMAANTALDSKPESAARKIARLAGAEPVLAAQVALQDGLKRSGKASRYTRGLNRGACELCQWLYKDGYEYPIQQPMHTHTGCHCTPVPVVPGV